jgi:hypothetical protein
MLTNTGIVNPSTFPVGTVGPVGSYSNANGHYAIANSSGNVGPGILTAADVIVDGKSLAKSIEAINKRLNILEPKKELLNKYEALQQAYEHYKTLEALLYESSK